MCLVIDTNCHPNFEPLVAAYDIEVTKVLTFGKKGWRTPYRDKKVRFIFNRAVLKSKMEITYDEVGKGIHSCLVYNKARDIKSRDVGALAFNAIIPKGSKFYYGTDGDIVSNKLIILKECAYI